MPRLPVGLVRTAAFTACLCLTLLSASPVAAQDVPRLTEAVTDQTGTLTQVRDGIDAALERLFQRTGVQLYVLFVSTTEGMDIADFAYEVGQQSLSPSDALLTVAIDDRTDNLSVGADLLPRVSQTSLDRVRRDVLEPGLASGDFGAAVIATADALGDVFPQPATPVPTAAPPTVAPPTPLPGPSQGGAGAGNFLILLLAGILIVLGLAIVVSRVARLRIERRALFEEAKTQERLGREANALLLQTDDALRDADQELLLAALDGLTDNELSQVLGLKLPALKKRWASLFERVRRVRPDLVPHPESDAVETRGPQKRHRLLAYLRDHPEELRPQLAHTARRVP